MSFAMTIVAKMVSATTPATAVSFRSSASTLPPPAIAVLAVIALPEVALLALCVMFRCGQASPEE